MNFKNIDEILNFAIAQEFIAVDFYKDLANKAKSENMKTVFMSYAKEEAKHAETLDKVKHGQKLVFSIEKVRDLKIADYVVDVDPNAEMNYINAIILAMKKEKAAFRLYSDLAELSTDENVKNLFTFLAQEEAKHKLRFELEYDNYVSKE